MNRLRSEALFQDALRFFPGGVNSPVRAFRAVGGSPLFIKKGDGCRIEDEDGNEYIDFCLSWGPLILGHNNSIIREKVWQTIQNGTSFGAPTRLENELADLILSNNRFIDKIRFVSSGTEAVMSAIRLARGYTGREKIIKFEGCYHGHADALLVKAGSGLVTFGSSSSAGVTQGTVQDTLVLPLNRIDLLEEVFKAYPAEIAALIIEPVPANNGLLNVSREFLQHLRRLCTEYQTVLIFDEVISGFRLGIEGAAGLFQIQPDLITFGKIIGGGFPVGAYAGRKEIMNCVSPEGNVYQAGTLSGNPVAMAAGIAALTECLKPGFYEQLEKKTLYFSDIINRHIAGKNYPFRMFTRGSIFWLSFSDRQTVSSAGEIEASGMSYFTQLHAYLLEQGIYLGPSGYEVGFISSAHSEQDLEKAAQKICNGLDQIFQTTVPSSQIQKS